MAEAERNQKPQVPPVVPKLPEPLKRDIHVYIEKGVNVSTGTEKLTK